MAEISAATVKKLRDITNAGMMDCKKALIEAEGEMERAQDLLREWGIAKSDKRAGRETRQGSIFSYIHHSNQVGVLLELNCETDFVAKTDRFRELGADLTMQIAASAPLYVAPEDVSEEDLERERRLVRQEALNEGKPEKLIDRIVEGRLKSYFRDYCLLSQPFVKDESKDIETLLKEVSGGTGEKISIARFARFQIGEASAS